MSNSTEPRPHDVGKWIRARREQIGLKVIEAAARSGVLSKTWQSWEDGTSAPDAWEDRKAVDSALSWPADHCNQLLNGTPESELPSLEAALRTSAYDRTNYINRLVRRAVVEVSCVEGATTSLIECKYNELIADELGYEAAEIIGQAQACLAALLNFVRRRGFGIDVSALSLMVAERLGEHQDWVPLDPLYDAIIHGAAASRSVDHGRPQREPLQVFAILVSAAAGLLAEVLTPDATAYALSHYGPRDAADLVMRDVYDSFEPTILWLSSDRRTDWPGSTSKGRRRES